MRLSPAAAGMAAGAAFARPLGVSSRRRQNLLPRRTRNCTFCGAPGPSCSTWYALNPPHSSSVTSRPAKFNSLLAVHSTVGSIMTHLKVT